MSLITYSLTPGSLLVSVLHAVKPKFRKLPLELIENVETLYSLDLYFQNQKLVPVATISNTKYVRVYKTLCVQLLHGIRARSGETAKALKLWAGLLNMRTRAIRLVSTKLMVGVVGELVAMVEDPLNCVESLDLVVEIIEQLWSRFLVGTWRDVHSTQRKVIAHELVDWAISCPRLFWNESTAKIMTEGLVDTHENVRVEWMKQTRRACLQLKVGTLGSNPVDLWLPLLQVYAELDSRGGSQNRRTAIELLTICNKDLSIDWCNEILTNCVAVGEPAETMVFALKLVWPKRNPKLVNVLLSLMDEGQAIKQTAELLGKTLVLSATNSAWAELTPVLDDLAQPEFEFILQILVVLAKETPELSICNLANSLMQKEDSTRLAWAAKLLAEVKEPSVRTPFFSLVERLLDLNVSEAGLIVSKWTQVELSKGGYRILEKPRVLPASLGLAGYVNATTQYTLAETARKLISEITEHSDRRSLYDELNKKLRNRKEIIELEELKVIIECLAKFYTTLYLLAKESKSRQALVSIEGSILYASLQSYLEVDKIYPEDELVKLFQCLEFIGGLRDPNYSVESLCECHELQFHF